MGEGKQEESGEKTSGGVIMEHGMWYIPRFFQVDDKQEKGAGTIVEEGWGGVAYLKGTEGGTVFLWQ